MSGFAIFSILVINILYYLKNYLYLKKKSEMYFFLIFCYSTTW